MLIRRRHVLSMLAAAALLAGCDKLRGPGKPITFASTDITEPLDAASGRAAPAFGQGLSLQDPKGTTRTMADFKGKVAVVFFGYTHCPDVCPTTLAELAGLKKALGPDGDRVQAVFVTVDPERDTPEVLDAYVGGFGPGFIGLRGTPEQTQAAAKDFKVFYARVPGKSEGAYTMDHTAAAYVFDPSGRMRLFVRRETPPEALLSDLRLLLSQAS